MIRCYKFNLLDRCHYDRKYTRGTHLTLFITIRNIAHDKNQTTQNINYLSSSFVKTRRSSDNQLLQSEM